MIKDKILIVKELKKLYPFTRGLFWSKPLYVKAVDGISFEINKGEIFGLIGESGCGKTTVGKLILRIIDKTEGKVLYKKQDIFRMKKDELRELRQKMQIIFQNPYEVLEPRLTTFKILSEPLGFHFPTLSDREKMERVKEILSSVDIKPPESFLFKHSFELSGGQLQRIAIARSLILNPEFLVADEPVSMLDISIRAGILKLLLKLKKENNMTYLFISHDLAISKFICDRLAVMYLGKIVEEGPSGKVLNEPLHPYTKALRMALPMLDPGQKYYLNVSKYIRGEIPNAIDIPQGCRFHPRCPHSETICSREEPKLKEFDKNRKVSCHLNF